MKKEQQHRIKRIGLLGLMGPMGLMGLIGLMGLMGCSKDEAAEPITERSAEVQLAGYVAGYEEAIRANRAYEANPITRGWTPPTGYSVFENSEHSISVFFTQGTDAGEERFFFTNNGKWRVNGNAIATGTYQFYGYVPHDKSITTTVTHLDNSSSYADGAVLTLSNVPTVTPSDYCVMIGAKNGDGNGYSTPGDYSITGLQRGNFQYVATGGGNNYVFLLFDHLFSAMRLRMKVLPDYNAERTIKLKELKLRTFANETPTKKKTTITITLTANNEANDPITNVLFTPYGEATEAGSMYISEDGFELTEDFQEFTGHFMPQGVDKVILESTYDVYDKKGNLVRPSCTASNTINLNMFSGQSEALRGRRYTVNLTINPTYLYVLSEPDLNSPDVTIEN